MNVALYGTPRRWAMTERGRADLSRSAEQISIGASSLRWDGDALHIDIDEPTVPLPSRLKGRVTVRPRGLPSRGFCLDRAKRHRWRPIGPLSDVEVSFDTPALTWRGTGYFDTNEGDEPLEAGFKSWTWSRFDMGDHARVFYDVIERDGFTHGLSLRCEEAAITDAEPHPFQPLPKTLWGLPRIVPGAAGTTSQLLRPLEDAPFYNRSAIASSVDGRSAKGVHESLDLRRLTSPIVRFMVPFRMFRRTKRAKPTGA